MIPSNPYWLHEGAIAIFVKRWVVLCLVVKVFFGQRHEVSKSFVGFADVSFANCYYVFCYFVHKSFVL